MDKEQFKQKLSEVADWQIPKLNDTEIKESLKAIRGRGRPSEEEQYQWEHMKQFLEIHNGTNPTSPLELTRVKRACDCEDCGRHCENGREQEIKYHPATSGHIAHWRVRCKTCAHYRHPETGEFDLPQGPAAQTFLNWAKRQYSLRKRQAKNQDDK